MTELLKKDNFGWSEEAQIAFNTMKEATITVLVLALSDLSKQFIIETDASGCGIGAVLMQNGHPIAYISKALSSLKQAMSIYEKEMLAILLAFKKWEHYLQYQHFVIKTDH